jgi:hypothetical protein
MTLTPERLQRIAEHGLTALVMLNDCEDQVIREMARELLALRAEVERLRAACEAIRDYPPAHRRDDEGYPAEVCHDEFAYKRIVDAYRKAASDALAEKARSQP